MVKAEYFLFCESKAVGDNGQLSLHNMFDKVYADNFPVMQRPFMAVARIAPVDKALVNDSIVITVTSVLNGKEINKLEATMQATIELGNAIVPGLDLSQFVLPEPGDYHFKLFADGTEIAEKVLQVRSTGELTEQ